MSEQSVLVAPPGTLPPPAPSDDSHWTWVDAFTMWYNVLTFESFGYQYVNGAWVLLNHAPAFYTPIGGDAGTISAPNPGGPDSGGVVSGGTVDVGNQPTKAQIDAGTLANASGPKLSINWLTVGGLALLAWAFGLESGRK
jgi:hypothetical protein